MLVVIGTDCIGSYKTNYHTIMTVMAPPFSHKNKTIGHVVYLVLQIEQVHL
jgi:hypothetical protein